MQHPRQLAGGDDGPGDQVGVGEDRLGRHRDGQLVPLTVEERAAAGGQRDRLDALGLAVADVAARPHELHVAQPHDHHQEQQAEDAEQGDGPAPGRHPVAAGPAGGGPPRPADLARPRGQAPQQPGRGMQAVGAGVPRATARAGAASGAAAAPPPIVANSQVPQAAARLALPAGPATPAGAATDPWAIEPVEPRPQRDAWPGDLAVAVAEADAGGGGGQAPGQRPRAATAGGPAVGQRPCGGRPGRAPGAQAGRSSLRRSQRGGIRTGRWSLDRAQRGGRSGERWSRRWSLRCGRADGRRPRSARPATGAGASAPARARSARGGRGRRLRLAPRFRSGGASSSPRPHVVLPRRVARVPSHTRSPERSDDGRAAPGRAGAARRPGAVRPRVVVVPVVSPRPPGVTEWAPGRA